MDRNLLSSRIMDTLCSSHGKCDQCGISNCEIPLMVNKLINAFELGVFDFTKKDDSWKSVEDELPIKDSPGDIVIHQSIGVIVYIEGETRPAYRIYERTTVRDKVVYRWKYPWDRISDEKITHWRYLPEKE